MSESDTEAENIPAPWKLVVRLPGRLADWLRGEAKDADELPSETIRRVLREAREDDEEESDSGDEDSDDESDDAEDETESEEEAD